MADLAEILPKPDPDVVYMLERLLERAKTGEIQSVAYAAVFSDGMTGNSFHGYQNLTLVGELSVLQREIIDIRVDMRMKKAGRGYLDD